MFLTVIKRHQTFIVNRGIMRLSPTGHAVAALSLVSLVALGPGTGVAVDEITGSDFDSSLVAVATLLLVALSAWTLACIGLSFAADRAGAARMLLHLITPRFVRRALFLGAAGALAIGPVSAVTGTDPGVQAPARSLTSRSLDGLRLPDRPVGASPARSVKPEARPHLVRVEQGDTLWSIAAEDLGPGAGAAEIATAVDRWYHANRKSIGSDPNLIFPHQKLTPPAKDS